MKKILFMLFISLLVVTNIVACNNDDEAQCYHVWDTVTTPPTCDECGYDVMTCVLCSEVIKTNITAATHKFSAEFIIDNEYHWQICSVCSALSSKDSHTLNDEGMCTICQTSIKPTPNIIYQISKDGTYAEVVGYTGNASKIKISNEYEGLPVKAIYDDAFQGMKNITYIDIPDSVTRIGYGAFRGCSSLISIVIPDSVTALGNEVFSGCSSLTYVTIVVELDQFLGVLLSFVEA